jgi:hypothetical protein
MCCSLFVPHAATATTTSIINAQALFQLGGFEKHTKCVSTLAFMYSHSDSARVAGGESKYHFGKKRRTHTMIMVQA